MFRRDDAEVSCAVVATGGGEISCVPVRPPSRGVMTL